jgi:hypothetical protein
MLSGAVVHVLESAAVHVFESAEEHRQLLVIKARVATLPAAISLTYTTNT